MITSRRRLERWVASSRASNPSGERVHGGLARRCRHAPWRGRCGNGACSPTASRPGQGGSAAVAAEGDRPAVWLSFRRGTCGPGPLLRAGAATFRIDDGGAHHGSGNTAVWAPLAANGIKGRGTQGILYRVEDGTITGAGYLIRQADLIAGKSFRGLSLREISLPAAQHLTIDLIKGATADPNQYLWLWHFLPRSVTFDPCCHRKLPSLTSLPGTFSATGMNVHPKGFYPRMGRHH